MPEWTWALMGAIGGSLLTLGVQLAIARTPTKDSQEALEAARREEAIDRFRWAAEMSTSSDEARRRFGVGQLRLLVDSRHLNADDYPLVVAAINSALAPKVTVWDAEDEVRIEIDGREGRSAVIITITPAERDLAQLAVDLAERMGKEPDPRMVALANASGPHARNESSRSHDVASSTTPPDAPAS